MCMDAKSASENMKKEIIYCIETFRVLVKIRPFINASVEHAETI